VIEDLLDIIFWGLIIFIDSVILFGILLYLVKGPGLKTKYRKEITPNGPYFLNYNNPKRTLFYTIVFICHLLIFYYTFFRYQ
jgi:hypothetical protein